MPRKRDPRREQAFEVWKQHDGDITNREIANRLDVPEKTIGAWKSKDNWNGVLHKKERSTPKEKSPKEARAPSAKKEQEPVAESGELNDKQRLFCMYYLKYFNAGKAYKKAYGCSMAAAYTNGPRLMKNACIRSEINSIKAEREEELALDQRAVIQKYIDIAFADITDYLKFGKKDIIVGHDEYGPVEAKVNYIDLNNSAELDGTIVTEVKQGRDGISVKLADKMKALEMLTKYFDLLPETAQRRLQEEKLRMEIKRAENPDGQDNEQWIAALKAVANKRRHVGDSDE